MSHLFYFFLGFFLLIVQVWVFHAIKNRRRASGLFSRREYDDTVGVTQGIIVVLLVIITVFNALRFVIFL